MTKVFTENYLSMYLFSVEFNAKYRLSFTFNTFSLFFIIFLCRIYTRVQVKYFSGIPIFLNDYYVASIPLVRTLHESKKYICTYVCVRHHEEEHTYVRMNLFDSCKYKVNLDIIIDCHYVSSAKQHSGYGEQTTTWFANGFRFKPIQCRLFLSTGKSCTKCSR